MSGTNVSISDQIAAVSMTCGHVSHDVSIIIDILDAIILDLHSPHALLMALCGLKRFQMSI